MKIDRVKVTRNDGVKGSAGHFKSDYDSYLQFTNLNTETNVTYTLHGFIKSTAAHTVSCLGQSGNTVANQWWEFIFQIIPPKTGFSFFFPPGEYWFYNWKLEKGLITTLWTPNGDDITDMKDTIITMGSSIEQLDKSITQKVWMTEVNSAKQKVEAHISTVEQTANKIHWLVKSGDSESNMTLTDNALNIITSYVNIHGKVTFSAIDADAVNKLTALHPVRNWDRTYTTINETVSAVVSDFNRTPRVNEAFTNSDVSANIGTWKITSVSGNKVGMQLLSFTPAKALQCKDNFNGSYTDTTKQYGLSIEKWFNREPLVNEIFKNYDTDSHLGVWKVISKNTTTVQVQLQSYTSVKGKPGKDGTDGKPGTNGRSALQAKRHWTSVYTTVGGTATANTPDFNRTPIVGDTFMNLDGSSNIGTWQITAISGTTVTMKLLSVINVKGDKGDTGKPGTNGKDGSKGLNSLQAKRNWTGTFTEVQATTNCATSDFNRTPVVGDVFTNLDGSCNIGTWQVTVINKTVVTIKLLFCNTTVSNINSTLKNVKSALNTIAPINNNPTKTVINGGKIATGTITANSIAANAITSAKIIANAVTTSKIATNAITADKIAANAVTANKISVSTLSAINANLGTITAGSLSAVSINNGNGTFKVDSSGNLTASKANIEGKITSNNSNTLYSTVINDGNIYTYGSKNKTSILTGVIASGKPLAESANNYDSFTINIGKNADALSFGIYYNESKLKYREYYVMNNGKNPDGITDRHIWYGTEYHGGTVQFNNYIDIFDNALRFYTTQGSVHPDNGRNFVGQIFGGYSTKGIYNLNIGGDVGDALILSIKNSNGLYVSYIAMKEQGLRQKIEISEPTYIGTLHLGANAIVDSDRRLKKDITSLNINKSSKFIYSLNPVSYKYKENDSDRFHHGLIAQEIKQSMGNDDWGVYVDNSLNKRSSYPMLGIRYEELIADIIATLQSQNNRIKFLETQIPQLQNQILQLQNQLNNINGGK